MSEYAELDAKGNVLQIIVIEKVELATGKWGNPKHFVRREDLKTESLSIKVLTGNVTL